jgi:hypothetical protein
VSEAVLALRKTGDDCVSRCRCSHCCWCWTYRCPLARAASQSQHIEPASLSGVSPRAALALQFQEGARAAQHRIALINMDFNQLRSDRRIARAASGAILVFSVAIGACQQSAPASPTAAPKAPVESPVASPPASPAASPGAAGSNNQRGPLPGGGGVSRDLLSPVAAGSGAQSTVAIPKVQVTLVPRDPPSGFNDPGTTSSGSVNSINPYLTPPPRPAGVNAGTGGGGVGTGPISIATTGPATGPATGP